MSYRNTINALINRGGEFTLAQKQKLRNWLDKNAFASSMKVGAGTGITTGTGTVYKQWIEEDAGIVKTRIFVDLTGLDSDATLGDIIGKGATALPCHIGQIRTEESGSLFLGTMECLEAPATGEVDIDVYSAVEGTGVTDGAIGDLTETVRLAAAADWTQGAVKNFATFPGDRAYLYLTVGTSSTPTAGTYTAGQFLITLYGQR